jgi:hypothetical protein
VNANRAWIRDQDASSHFFRCTTSMAEARESGPPYPVRARGPLYQSNNVHIPYRVDVAHANRACTCHSDTEAREAGVIYYT